MSVRRKFALSVLAVVVVVLALPASLSVPVAGATRVDWHPQSFWYEPWGASGVHKGIDIFAPKGRDVIAAAPGIVLYAGEIARGGKVVLTLGAKWRVQYYAHLDSIDTRIGAWLSRHERIGAVGATGNAVGKSPHLHFSVVTLPPYPWRIDGDAQGWKKMFYLDPARLIVR